MSYSTWVPLGRGPRGSCTWNTRLHSPRCLGLKTWLFEGPKKKKRTRASGLLKKTPVWNPIVSDLKPARLCKKTRMGPCSYDSIGILHQRLEVSGALGSGIDGKAHLAWVCWVREIYCLKLRLWVWIFAVGKKKTNKKGNLGLFERLGVLIAPEKKPTNMMLSAHMIDYQNLVLAWLPSRKAMRNQPFGG